MRLAWKLFVAQRINWIEFAGPAGGIEPEKSAHGSGEVTEMVVADLIREMQSGKYVVDRFAQRLSRPYGDVWREA